MRVLFMGTPEYARIILEALVKTPEVEVVAAVTKPDRPVGRKKVLTPPPVKTFAEERNIPVLQPENLKGQGMADTLAAYNPELIVVAAFGQLLPKAVLDVAPCVNLHTSLLPKYRGASPAQATLKNGDRFAGVAAMLMDVGLDTGDTLAFSQFTLEGEERTAALLERLADLAAELTVKVIRRWEKIRPVPQNECDASHVGKIRKEEGRVELDDAVKVFNRFRAFHPWPGIFLESGLALREIALESEEGFHVPGALLALEKEEAVVGCAKGSLRIKTVQAPSKKPMDAASYLRGKRADVGDLLS